PPERGKEGILWRPAQAASASMEAERTTSRPIPKILLWGSTSFPRATRRPRRPRPEDLSPTPRVTSRRYPHKPLLPRQFSSGSRRWLSRRPRSQDSRTGTAGQRTLRPEALPGDVANGSAKGVLPAIDRFLGERSQSECAPPGLDSHARNSFGICWPLLTRT